MIGSSFVYDGLQIPYTAPECRLAGWTADVTWTNYNVRNTTNDRPDFHGTESLPTYAGSRIIVISGEIFSTDKVRRGEIRKVLDDKFRVLSFPTKENQFKVLSFTDDDGEQWQVSAKVIQPPIYDAPRGSNILAYSLQLLCDDPTIKSLTPVTESGIYGTYGGVSLPTVLPTTLDSTLNEIVAENQGSFSAPVKFTLSGQIVNPKIINITTGRYFGLDREIELGQELIIDTNTLEVTINGTSAISSRSAGSNWLYAVPGNNTFVLVGQDFDFGDQSKAEYEIEFFNTRI